MIRCEQADGGPSVSKEVPICLTRGTCLLMPPGSAGGLNLLNRALKGPTWQGVIWGLALISRDPHLTQGITNWGPLNHGWGPHLPETKKLLGPQSNSQGPPPQSPQLEDAWAPPNWGRFGLGTFPQ